MKKRKVKNNKIILCVVGMVVLVIAALFLPQIIFEIQDKYRMTNTEVEARESLDIFQLNLSYEKQLSTRMYNFLKANQKMVTALDYEVTEGSDQAQLLETILYQDWFYILMDYSINSGFDNFDILYKILYKSDMVSNVQDCRRYLVYGSNYERMLMMWYYDVYLSDNDIRMQLVVDSETGTIYYMKLSSDERQVKTAKVVEIYDSSYEYVVSFMDFYYTYYEAGYGTSAEMEINENQYQAEMEIPYRETGMTFLFQVTFGNSISPDITIGIKEIGELIPEMMQE